MALRQAPSSNSDLPVGRFILTGLLSRSYVRHRGAGVQRHQSVVVEPLRPALETAGLRGMAPARRHSCRRILLPVLRRISTTFDSADFIYTIK
jgi:hypothetical protein